MAGQASTGFQQGQMAAMAAGGGGSGYGGGKGGTGTGQLALNKFGTKLVTKQTGVTGQQAQNFGGQDELTPQQVQQVKQQVQARKKEIQDQIKALQQELQQLGAV
jgi:hypothetical protein